MSMIRVENLTFAYPSSYDNIFENVNFQIDTDWKLGFVGRNGRGKTTFLICKRPLKELLSGQTELKRQNMGTARLTEDILVTNLPK